MSKKGIARDLEFRINQLANRAAQRSTSLTAYRKSYQENKARLLAHVITRLTSGKTPDEVLDELPTIRVYSYSKLLATYNALLKAIIENT